MKNVSVVFFDAYGTLFDVYAVGVTAEQLFPGMGKSIANLWRDKQIEYTRLRALSQRYKPFWDITVDALEYVSDALGLQITDTQRRQLLDVYSALPAYPENRQVLQRLRESNVRTAILSNGDPVMLKKAVSSAGLADLLDATLSVEPLQTFKTDPVVYQYGLDQMGVSLDKALFVSSNGWDACGASWFGLRALWVNRAALPMERLDVVPTHEGRSLFDVLKVLGVDA